MQNIVHYDLKCDNFLLEPLETIQSNEEFWQPQWPPQDATCAIPFRVSIADFGQSKVQTFFFLSSFKHPLFAVVFSFVSSDFQ